MQIRFPLPNCRVAEWPLSLAVASYVNCGVPAVLLPPPNHPPSPLASPPPASPPLSLPSHHLQDECGMAAIIGDAHSAAFSIYYGLYALQHRGQESCGIAINRQHTPDVEDTEHECLGTNTSSYEMHAHKDFGLVSDVFSPTILHSLPGNSAIGHVRYATAESGRRENIQPFCFTMASSMQVALAHNGNLTNAQKLRQDLEQQGSVFTSTSDTEVVVHLMALSSAKTIAEKIQDVFHKLRGGFSLVFLAEEQIYALRDAHGLRPLVFGKKNNTYVVASETCALDLLDVPWQRDIEPGELLHLTSGQDPVCYRLTAPRPMAFCAFEPIYFSRPDSWCGNESVYEIRKRIGRVLAKLYPTTADCIIAVPDSSIPIAIGYSQATGIPLEWGMIRNHYIGRTFIEPSQGARDLGVKLKFNATQNVLQNKDCVVIDDSIVRGTTSTKIVRMLKKAGARKVHFRVGSPPVTHSCHYGISTPNRKKLMAAQINVNDIRKSLDVDSLGYLTREALSEALQAPEHSSTCYSSSSHSHRPAPAMSYCMACFNGSYPVTIDSPLAYEKHPTDDQGCGYYSQK